MNALHPDWEGLAENPSSDLGYALQAETQMTAAPIPTAIQRAICYQDIAEVVRYAVSYHGAQWKPGDETGTELSLCAVARAKDGRWVAVEGWNDYTGWGCQDGADIRVGATEDQVVRYGLSESARGWLGYPSAVPS